MFKSKTSPLEENRIQFKDDASKQAAKHKTALYAEASESVFGNLEIQDFSSHLLASAAISVLAHHKQAIRTNLQPQIWTLHWPAQIKECQTAQGLGEGVGRQVEDGEENF